MSLLPKLFVLPLMLLLQNAYGQMNYEIGYTGAWLYTRPGIAGGLSFYAGRNIAATPSSSLSVGTRIKVGMEDKIGTGVVVPVLVVLISMSDKKTNISNIKTGELNGGTIHLFADLPLLLHYNFGLGANDESEKMFGFYLGGGITYIRTGYTDTAGYSKGTGFFGYVMDGGVRAGREQRIGLDLSTVIPSGRPVGLVKNPVLSEITLSLLLEHKTHLRRHR